VSALLRAVALVLGVLAVGLVLAQGAPRNDDGTFRNNYPHATTSFGDFLRWQSERSDVPEPAGGWRTPTATPDLAALRGPAKTPSVTWIGHATVLLRLGGLNILVAPVFPARASPVAFAGPKRIAPLPIDIADLPPIDVVLITHNTALNMTMCVNYGGRAELGDAMRRIAQDVVDGKIKADKIDERTIAKYLYQPEMPDVDLFLRPSGQQRTSNFMLWQSAYAEMVFQDTLFPDFDRTHLWNACLEFAKRDRRFGAAVDQAEAERAAGEAS